LVLHGKKNKAQSILEYATVIACAVAALLAMQVYIKRAYQGKLKQTADSFGSQYAPRKTTGNIVTTYNSDSVTQSIILTEQDIGYDADGDGAIEDDVTVMRTISGYGSWNDGNGDGVVQPDEISGGTLSTRSGTEKVGKIKADEDLFDE
jgi:hypothetical protein